MESDIKPGDVVRLKSGSITMTVVRIDGDDAVLVFASPDCAPAVALIALAALVKA